MSNNAILQENIAHQKLHCFNVEFPSIKKYQNIGICYQLCILCKSFDVFPFAIFPNIHTCMQHTCSIRHTFSNIKILTKKIVCNNYYSFHKRGDTGVHTPTSLMYFCLKSHIPNYDQFSAKKGVSEEKYLFFAICIPAKRVSYKICPTSLKQYAIHPTSLI